MVLKACNVGVVFISYGKLFRSMCWFIITEAHIGCGMIIKSICLFLCWYIRVIHTFITIRTVAKVTNLTQDETCLEIVGEFIDKIYLIAVYWNVG